MWLRRHFVAFVILFAAFVTIANGSLPRNETSRIEEPCGIVLIGACLPRRVAAWEQTEGTIAENVQGFTLIELSIVLVVIGLIVGGILVGQDLIKAAETQATIAQIEKFNTAVGAFRNKYNAIPGDIQAAQAAQFGFVARAGTQGRGDGNGLIEGYSYNNNAVWPYAQTGETVMFWSDLSSANMIDGTFNSATDGQPPLILTPTTTPSMNAYVPLAKLGNGNYIYVYSYNGFNYFALAALVAIGTDGNNHANTALTVAQAYNIDKKIDDGLPQSGKVLAQYLYYSFPPYWAKGGNDGELGYPPGAAAPSGASTCYDNGGNASAAMQYSMEVSNGGNPNCALTFQMQGAAR